MDTLKPTLNKPTVQGAKFQSNTRKIQNQVGLKMNETDNMLSEVEQSLKKKIFSLAKMEALVFSDPKLSAVYEEMSANGEERYGYHYNETIMNLIFNDYVLNSTKYLQKYKQAVPKEKKRRDKSGINQLKKTGVETMKHKTDIKPTKLAPTGLKPAVAENDEPLTKVEFLVNERDPENPDLFAYFPEDMHHGEFRTGYSHVGQHSAVHPNYAKESRPATPEEYASLKAELEGLGYNLEVINATNEADSGSSGSFAPALGIQQKELEEGSTTSSVGGSGMGSGAYVGPAAWGSGDLMKSGGKSKAMRKPIWKGGSIIQENKVNYLIDPREFEKYVKTLNEDDSYGKVNDQYQSTHTNSNKGLGVSSIAQSGDRKAKENKISNNSMSYANKDLNKMRDKDVDILHNDMTKENSFFPHKNNPNLKDDGISGTMKENNRSNEINYIDKKSDAYGTETNNMSNGNLNVIDNQLKTGKVDKPNLNTMEEAKKINEKAVSKKQQKFMGMVHAVQKGELNSDKVGGKVAKAADTMTNKDAKDFASTKHKGLPEKIKEDTQTMIQNNGTSMSNKALPTGDQSGNMDVGVRSTGGGSMSESKDDLKLLEELNNELNAYSIHHKKLKQMSEDRRPSSLIAVDRLGDENKANFKKDLQKSDTKQVIDVEKELEWKDQQTEVGKDPQKLGQEIEKKELKVTDGGQALKDVGNSANDKGDEIPKRNLSAEEQKEVNNYRLGLGDYIYDNEPGKRFEDRMKADMGEKLYKQRQDKLAFRGKAPMYNKDTQPTEIGTDKAQFDKEKSGWNDRESLKESAISGKYFDNLNKRKIIDFNLNEVVEIKDSKSIEKLQEVSLEGMGNTYNNKVDVNENAVKAMNKYKFFTDGKKVFAMKNPVQKLNENEQKEKKRPINEQFEKMKHLTGYDPADFTNTKSTKKNRGF
jgi:hypothetical protein